MSYISKCRWRDLTDGHLYAEGDLFPHDGRQIPPDRLHQLETGQNGAGMALIQAEAGSVEQEPVQKEKAPEGAKTARKTARAKKQAG